MVLFILLVFIILAAIYYLINESHSIIGIAVIKNSVPVSETAVFSDSTRVDNSYFPLEPGTVRLYFAETEKGVEITIAEVLKETRAVNGVLCVVVRERVFLNGLPIEDTHDWYAQDDKGNVRYMGEKTVNFKYEEYSNYVSNVGMIKEEQVNGEKSAELKALFHTGIEQIPGINTATFTNPLAIDNTYAPFIPGDTKTYISATENSAETIVVEVLEKTKVVNGVACIVVRDRVYSDDLIIEDTHDWYAQDDRGNVWYMGEEVINFEYNEKGDLIDTNNDGSWEAGMDGALSGIYMWADPGVGMSYYQEYYGGKAEDMGFIVADGVRVEFEDGTIYKNCLQVLDWNPLDPGVLEFKYYAPKLGLIKEEVLGGSETVLLTPTEKSTDL